ncbi:unnamed protein product [Staurois parvus]|uniref:Uncharacterized protein n=1 Tax=Staurois parvus TaxID=386267 RepID=A0ABN9HBU8_9NEOB|nr:unnamed protein product [Staurois parvus]
MGPPTDPGPSGSARVSKWSVRPYTCTCVHGQIEICARRILQM